MSVEIMFWRIGLIELDIDEDGREWSKGKGKEKKDERK